MIDKVVTEYGRSHLEPEIRHEFIEKIKTRIREKTVKVADFKNHYGLE